MLASRRPLVLHVRGVTGEGGGPEKTILNSPRFLSQYGYDCRCAYMHPPADAGFEKLRRRAEAAKATLVSIPDRGATDWRVLRDLLRLCRSERASIWHGHDYKSNALGLLVRRMWPMKLVTTAHGWVKHTRKTPLYYRIDKFCLRQYDEVICVSEDLYEQALELGVPKDRCHLIHNAIDTDEYRRDGGRRADNPPGARTLTIGAMGRLSAEKGFDYLIRAVDRLLDEGLHIALRIAGAGDARDELDRLIADLGRQDHVRLLGHVDDPKQFFQDLDIFVLSSLREGLPNVLLEAMACEVPVVATHIAGVPTLIRDDETGLLVQPGSVAELVSGLRRLATLGELRERLARAARELIEQSYRFDRRMQKVVQVYDRLLGRESQPSSAAASCA